MNHTAFRFIVFSSLIASLGLSACSSRTQNHGQAPSTLSAPAAPTTPLITAPAPESLQFNTNGVALAKLNNQKLIAVHRLQAGKYYFIAEGVLSDLSFQALTGQFLQPALDEVQAQLAQSQVAVLKRVDDIGYLRVWVPYNTQLFQALEKIPLRFALSFEPQWVRPDDIAAGRPRPITDEAGASAPSIHLSENLSGMDLMGVRTFVRQASAEVGEVINGSTVRVGITDTGLTLNHPTFESRSQPGKPSRVAYLRDTTSEGYIYFSRTGRFEAKSDDNASGITTLSIDAEVIDPVTQPAMPKGDELREVKNLRIVVSPELKAKLLDPSQRPRLGIYDEATVDADSDPVDINQDGKRDSKFYAIALLGNVPAEDVIYVDFSGRHDFSQARPLTHWNSTRQTQAVGLEQIGVDFRDVSLPSQLAPGVTVAVHAAALVGFDPGNHGSHVAGIAAGSQTLQGDSLGDAARGMAPEAQILMNRVCANNTGCGATEGFTDLVLEGKADVVNMSLGGLSPLNDGTGVQETLINRLIETKNVLFVNSAGNSGPGKQTVGSPSVARLALSVGAAASRGMIEDQYQWPARSDLKSTEPFMLFFSSRGPSAAGGFKPNLAAPGTQLSSIQLNSAPGHLAGLTVYWGTSMAAPAATGAYALLLDAVRKYNARHASDPLPSDALTLRRVLIESAQPFRAKRGTDEGEYTWIDQGTGMLNLPAAWSLLKRHKATEPKTALQDAGAAVQLEYEPLIDMKNPSGVAFDGTRSSTSSAGQRVSATPIFGNGLYLDSRGNDTLYSLDVIRRLPRSLQSRLDLERDLRTTADRFILKTVIYGSKETWLTAGVSGSLDCTRESGGDFLLVGQGTAILTETTADGKVRGSLAHPNHSLLHLCVDRTKMAALPPGDHGALVYAYRTRDGKISPVASFIVPVYLHKAHQSLSQNQMWAKEAEIEAFTVHRNYVQVLPQTHLVRVTLEVPQAPTDAAGNVLPGGCSSVELMGYQAENTGAFFSSRREAVVTNCSTQGSALPAERRTLTFVKTAPRPGLWDVHVMGRYGVPLSRYSLKVEYLNATASTRTLVGTSSSLEGKFNWAVTSASQASSATNSSWTPSAEVSLFELRGFRYETTQAVEENESTFVPLENGNVFRSYPADVRTVTVSTSGSVGNDIDLVVMKCKEAKPKPADADCSVEGKSGGATDVETVTFEPDAKSVYLVRVDGFAMPKGNDFDVKESLTAKKAEAGSLKIALAAVETPTTYEVSYQMPADILANSKLLKSMLFTANGYQVWGALELKSNGQSRPLLLDSLDVVVQSPATP